VIISKDDIFNYFNHYPNLKKKTTELKFLTKIMSNILLY